MQNRTGNTHTAEMLNPHIIINFVGVRIIQAKKTHSETEKFYNLYNVAANKLNASLTNIYT